MQRRNAATAIAALRALDAPFTADVFARGVRAAHAGARLQAFDRDGARVLVDVGHNPQAAAALAQALAAAPATGRTHAVYAALADKDHAGVVDALAGMVDAWHLAGTVDAGARGLDADGLAARLEATAARGATRHADAARALHDVLAVARTGDRVLVFGSFHAAAAALQALGPR